MPPILRGRCLIDAGTYTIALEPVVAADQALAKRGRYHAIVDTSALAVKAVNAFQR